MTKLTKLCLGLGLAAGLAGPTLAQDQAQTKAPDQAQAAALTPDTVIATVNGENITVGQIALANAALGDKYKSYPPDVLYKALRNQLVQQALLEQSMKEIPQQLDILIANERRRMIASAAVNKIADAAVTDEAVKAAYAKDYAGAPPTKEYHASHILLKTEDDANAALKRAKAGEDFAALARELSTGPSGPNGGDLGWFSPDHMVKPFADAVVAMKAGDIAGPVQTQFGWHVIKLDEVRDKPVPALADVRADIVKKLRQDAAQAAVKKMQDEAKVVEVDGIDPAAALDGSVFQSK
jgi:peptidyl-prolyl cis-trans isomerase C